MRKIKKSFIDKQQVKELFNKMDNHISTHELSMWLKSNTDDEWVVVPKFFCTAMIEFIENEFKEAGITDKWGKNHFLQEVKQYL